MLIRTKYAKDYTLRFISHLDLMRVFQRAIRRAHLPIAFSKGFNPHQKISFGSALAVGCTSEGEFADFELKSKIPPEDFMVRLNKALPEGIRILDVTEIPKNTPSLMSEINTAVYHIKIKLPESLKKVEVKHTIERFMELEDIKITKVKKNRQKEIDIRPLIYKLEVLDFNEDCVEIKAVVETGNRGSLNPGMLVQAFNKYKVFSGDVRLKKAHRKGLFIKTDDGLISPIEKSTKNSAVEELS